MIVGNKVDKVRDCYSRLVYPVTGLIGNPPSPRCVQEFSRTVSTQEGAAFAASRNPPWMFMECSAKKGGNEIIGEEGVFGQVVEKARLLV